MPPKRSGIKGKMDHVAKLLKDRNYLLVAEMKGEDGQFTTQSNMTIEQVAEMVSALNKQLAKKQQRSQRKTKLKSGRP